jgi:hypothetical protein
MQNPMRVAERNPRHQLKHVALYRVGWMAVG